MHFSNGQFFKNFNSFFSKRETLVEIAFPIAQLTPQVADMMAMLCFSSFSSYRDPQLFTTTLQGVTSKWRRLTTVYQGLSIRFRRALTLLRGNDRVTAKSWSTTRGGGGLTMLAGERENFYCLIWLFSTLPSAFLLLRRYFWLFGTAAAL